MFLSETVSPWDGVRDLDSPGSTKTRGKNVKGFRRRPSSLVDVDVTVDQSRRTLGHGPDPKPTV